MIEPNIYKIGITPGDTNGIGYELILKIFADERVVDLFTPILYGSRAALHYYQQLLDMELPLTLHLIRSACDAQLGVLNLVESTCEGTPLEITPGSSSTQGGQMAAQALLMARTDLEAGVLHGLVTAPINKESIQSDEFQFSGHTEFLGEHFTNDEPLMLFSDGGRLNVALLTRHLPLESVSKHLSSPYLSATLRQYEQVLRADFGLEKPRIAVLALNPHAGEQGLIGREEQEVIIPTIRALRQEGLHVFGPYAADGFWGSHQYEQFDGVMAMYHDQGLIPFKMLSMTSGVNVTAGLPIVRTSPDHGTAYDIAGKGIANPDSMRQAIYTAIDIIRHRYAYSEMTAHPLVKKYVERGKDNYKLDLS